VNFEKYRMALTRFLNEARGRVSIDHFQLLVQNLRHQIQVVASGGRIPLAAGGGSLASMLSFVPFLVYAGHVVLQDGDARKGIEGKVEALVEGGEAVEEAMVLGLWAMSMAEWLEVRVELLRRLVKSKGKREENLWEGVKEQLFFFVLLDRMQKIMKAACPGQVVRKESRGIRIGPHKGEPWLVGWMERVVNEGCSVAKDFEELAIDFDDSISGIDCVGQAMLAAGLEGGDEWVTAAFTDA
jgi:hypothetical protein